MADVFISYAREDQARAEHVARGLEAMGLDAFWDTEIPPGQTWADYIESKLSNCKAVIVLWSEHSTRSQWVREEARMGRDKSKLIPAMLDGSPAPFGFGEVQAANLATWRGEPNHPDWQRFSRAVYSAVNGPGAAPPKPQPAPAYSPPPQAAAGGAQLSPIGYIQKCFRLYADGKGRARRSEFGWFLLLAFAATFIAAIVDVSLFGIDPYTGAANSYALTLIAGLALLAPMVAAASRRAHDFGQSGWLAALTAIPYLGFLVALVFVFIPGQSGGNGFGPDPKA
jgi:uncharacterized membrane protein YhaH (DUF805 family)